MTALTAVQVVSGGYEKSRVQSFAKELNFTYSKIRLSTCAELLPNLPGEVVDRCPSCEMLRKFSEDCNLCVRRVGSVGSEKDEYAGQRKHISAELYFLS